MYTCHNMVSHVLCTSCIVDLIICGCAERGVYVEYSCSGIEIQLVDQWKAV